MCLSRASTLDGTLFVPCVGFADVVDDDLVSSVIFEPSLELLQFLSDIFSATNSTDSANYSLSSSFHDHGLTVVLQNVAPLISYVKGSWVGTKG